MPWKAYVPLFKKMSPKNQEIYKSFCVHLQSEAKFFTFAGNSLRLYCKHIMRHLILQIFLKPQMRKCHEVVYHFREALHR